MIMMIVLGVALALVVAPNVDMLIHTLRGMGFDAGAGTEWDSTSAFWTAHNILICLLYSPGPLGVLIFLLSCTRRQRRDDSGLEAGAIYGIEE